MRGVRARCERKKFGSAPASSILRTLCASPLSLASKSALLLSRRASAEPPCCSAPSVWKGRRRSAGPFEGFEVEVEVEVVEGVVVCIVSCYGTRRTNKEMEKKKYKEKVFVFRFLKTT